MLSLVGSPVQARQRPRFYYEACWALDKGCQDVIKKSWRHETSHGIGWERLKSKLGVCAKDVLLWRRKTKCNTQEAISKLQRRLLLLQIKEDRVDATEIKKIQFDLHGLLEKEELW